jgi:hypothetical protein
MQRKRKLLTRLAALVALGVGGLLAVMPHPGANEAAVAANEASLSEPMRLLLTPSPLSSARFLGYYAIVYR